MAHAGANYWELLGDQRIRSIENLFAGPDLSQKPQMAAVQALEDAMRASCKEATLRTPLQTPRTPFAAEFDQKAPSPPDIDEMDNGSERRQSFPMPERSGGRAPEARPMSNGGGGEAAKLGNAPDSVGVGEADDGVEEQTRFTADMIAAEAARQKSAERAKYGVRPWRKQRQIQMNGSVVKVDSSGTAEEVGDGISS